MRKSTARLPYLFPFLFLHFLLVVFLCVSNSGETAAATTGNQSDDEQIDRTINGESIFLPLLRQNHTSSPNNGRGASGPVTSQIPITHSSIANGSTTHFSKVDGSTADDLTQNISIEGVIEIVQGAQPLLRNPWGTTYPIALDIPHSGSSALTDYSGTYVRLSGRWINSVKPKVFIATNIRMIAKNGVAYASYVSREMSDPAKRSAAQHEGQTERRAIEAGAADNPAQVGEWSAVQDIGMYALHAVLRPDGQVMFWYRTAIEDDDILYGTILWDPFTKEITHLSNESLDGQENWCATHTQLGDGRMLAATGNVGSQDPHADIFDFRTEQWTSIPDLNFGRYYPSATYMGDGRVVISGGDYLNLDTQEVPNPFPEVWENGAWRKFDEKLVTTPSEIEFDFYYGSFFPWTQQAPNGLIFYAGPQSTLRYLDPDNGGTVTTVGNRDGLSRDYGGYATYDVGKILIAGGGDSLSSAYTIDINQNPPLVLQTGSLLKGRRNFYTTLLADGTVLATGGNSDGGITQASASGAVYFAELWDQSSGTWSRMASMDRRREYHSAAILLPDARVVHAGGDCTPCAPQDNLEVFSPPYLFNSDGTPATRPVIDSMPNEIDYGQLFQVEFSQASGIAAANLIRLGSSTHSTNFDQRLVPLDFDSETDDNSGRLLLRGPLNIFTAPPGYYMLFLINDDGVPSVAEILKVGAHIQDPQERVGLLDGGFENSQTPGSGTWITYFAGETFGGWSVTHGDVNVQNNDHIKPADGSGGEQSVDLNGSVPGRISQVVTNLKPDQSYQLTFNYAIHHLAEWASATVEIANLDEPLLATNRGDEEWLTATYSFTATSIEHTLVFSSNGGLTYAGMLLDDIHINDFVAEIPSGRPPVNLALNRPATQSSNSSTAMNAVDGNNSGDGTNGEISLTDLDDEAWWQVDLGEMMAIDKIEIWNRTNCCQKNSSNLYIFISEGDPTGKSLDELLSDPSVQRGYLAGTLLDHHVKPLKGMGRYVRIQSTLPTELGLAEVAVLAPPVMNSAPVLALPDLQLTQLGESVDLRIDTYDENDDEVTLLIEDLPIGLLSNSEGAISGTATTAGFYTVTVTASDVYSGIVQERFGWQVNTPPTLNDPGTQAHNVGDVILLPLETDDADGDSLTFLIDVLPGGLTLEPQGSIISGTLTTAQIVSSTITISDSYGGVASIVIGWQINGPPLLAQLPDMVSTLGDTVDQQFQATDDGPEPLAFSAEGLPPTLILISDTGQLSGTLMTAGTYTVSIAVRDVRGLDDSNTFRWYVNSPPQLAEVSPQLVQLRDLFTLTLPGTDPDGDPLFFRATGLPNSIMLDSQTGILSGTLTVGGSFTSTIVVTDTYGASAQTTLSWIVNHPPILEAMEAQLHQLNADVQVPVVAVDEDDDLLRYSAENLPPGLSMDEQSGIISGTTTTSGRYLGIILVTDGQGGRASIPVSWQVNEPPIITAVVTQTVITGEDFTIQLSAQDEASTLLTYEATLLPPGLTLDSTSGQLSGQVATPGVYLVMVTVRDKDGGSSSITFALTVKDPPEPPTPEPTNSAPQITSPGDQQSEVGKGVSLFVQARDLDSQILTFRATGLPDGLTLTESSGLISGRATTPGTTIVTVTVDDGRGGTDQITFTWLVEAAGPDGQGPDDNGSETFLPFVAH